MAAELVTPTGAAIIASLAESFGPLPPMRVEKTGYGAGQRELADRPNLLRIMTGPLAAVVDGLSTDEIRAVIEGE